MALDTTINDMDIDMDFDEAEDPEITRLRAEAAELDAVWTNSVKRRLQQLTSLFKAGGGCESRSNEWS